MVKAKKTSENQAEGSGVTFVSRREKSIRKKNPQSMSKKAGLDLPVLKIFRQLRNGNYAKKVHKGKKTNV
jgi:hypothetical protein